ncbi:MAG: AsnC family transcriptional regulator [Candidatus Lokiarchaeota archaeon]|nr:AsnC family transcriptional regulator [Candidatus Lokiarchaeota archaeon]
MDEIDVKICMMLLQNSRRPYRELADSLEISVNAVHKRVQKLIATKVIRGFTTNLSISSLNTINAIIFGKSKNRDIEMLQELLSKDENTYWLAIAGGNELYIGGYLRELNEMDSYVEKIQDIAQLIEPTVGIVSHDSGQTGATSIKKELDKIDWRILQELHNDSRKSFADIAEELNVSAKTIRRRLEVLEENDQIQYSINWYPEASNDIISVFQIFLQASVDKQKVGLDIIKKYFPNTLFFWSFGNIPNSIIVLAWNETMRDLTHLRLGLEEFNEISSITTNIIYSGHVFDTWREGLLE